MLSNFGLRSQTLFRLENTIIELNGKKLGRTYEILRLVRNRAPSIELTVKRGKKNVKVKFKTADLVDRLQGRPTRRGDGRRRRRNDR